MKFLFQVGANCKYIYSNKTEKLLMKRSLDCDELTIFISIVVSLIEKYSGGTTMEDRTKALLFSSTLVILADEVPELKQMIHNNAGTILSGLQPCSVDMECITQKAAAQLICQNKQLVERVSSSLKSFLESLASKTEIFKNNPSEYIKSLGLIQFLDKNQAIPIQQYDKLYFWGLHSDKQASIFKGLDETISKSQLEHLLQMDKLYPILKMPVLHFLPYEQLSTLLRTEPLMSKLFTEKQILAVFCCNLKHEWSDSVRLSILQSLEEYLDLPSTNLGTLDQTDTEFIVDTIFQNCQIP